MTATALVYGATISLAVLYVLATIGILVVAGELVCRLARFHRRGIARLKASR